MDVKDLEANFPEFARGLRLYSIAWSKEDAFQQAHLYFYKDKRHDPNRVGKLLSRAAARRIREQYSSEPLSEDILSNEKIEYDLTRLLKRMNGLQTTICKLILEGWPIKRIADYLEISIDKCYRTIKAIL